MYGRESESMVNLRPWKKWGFAQECHRTIALSVTVLTCKATHRPLQFRNGDYPQPKGWRLITSFSSYTVVLFFKHLSLLVGILMVFSKAISTCNLNKHTILTMFVGCFHKPVLSISSTCDMFHKPCSLGRPVCKGSTLQRETLIKMGSCWPVGDDQTNHLLIVWSSESKAKVYIEHLRAACVCFLL